MKFFKGLIENLVESIEGPKESFLWLKFTFTRNLDCSSFIQLNSIKLFDKNGNRIFIDYDSVTNPNGKYTKNKNPHHICGEGEEKWRDSNFRKTYQSIISFRFKFPFGFNEREGIEYELWTASDCPDADPVEWKVESKKMSDLFWNLVDERRYVIPPKSRNSPYSRFQLDFNYQPLLHSKMPPLTFDHRIDPALVNKRSSLEITNEWNQRLENEGVLQEYKEAKEIIYIHWDFMKESRMKRCISYSREFIKTKPLSENFHEVLKLAIEKAYGGNVHFLDVKDALDPSRTLFSDIMSLFHLLDSWRKELMHLAIRELTVAEDSAGLIGMLNLLSRAGVTCQARQIQAFHSLMLRFFSLRNGEHQEDKYNHEEHSSEIAKRNVRDFIEEWIEMRKIRAFKRAFIDPCMTMMLLGGSEDEDVEVHGVNVFSALLSSTLGIETSIVPFLHDHIKGICTFLAPKSTRSQLEDALKPSQLYNPFPKSLSELNWMEKIDLCPHSFLFGGQSPAVKAITASSYDLSTQRDRKMWGEHLKIFACFFAKEYILEPLFVSMIGDEGPLSSLQVLFDDMKKEEKLANEIEDVREWIYDTNRDYQFDSEKADKLMRFLGIVNG